MARLIYKYTFTGQQGPEGIGPSFPHELDDGTILSAPLPENYFWVDEDQYTVAQVDNASVNITQVTDRDELLNLIHEGIVSRDHLSATLLMTTYGLPSVRDTLTELGIDADNFIDLLVTEIQSRLNE